MRSSLMRPDKAVRGRGSRCRSEIIDPPGCSHRLLPSITIIRKGEMVPDESPFAGYNKITDENYRDGTACLINNTRCVVCESIFTEEMYDISCYFYENLETIILIFMFIKYS